jgi:hypothetical protein
VQHKKEGSGFGQHMLLKKSFFGDLAHLHYTAVEKNRMPVTKQGLRALDYYALACVNFYAKMACRCLLFWAIILNKSCLSVETKI